MAHIILSFGFGGEQVAISIEIHKEIRRRVEAHLLNLGFAFSRTSLEAGPLASWLYAGTIEMGLDAGQCAFGSEN